MFEFGFYEKEITPPLGCGIPGYFSLRRGVDVQDRLYARAMVVKEGEEKIAILSIDGLHPKTDICKNITDRITEFTGIPREKVMIAFTHSHTALPFRFEGIAFADDEVCAKNTEGYPEMFAKLVADCVTLADLRLKKATPSFGMGRVDGISFCRDYIMMNATPQTNPPRLSPDIIAPVTESDKDLPVLMIRGEDGKEMGAIIGFACHADCVSGEKLTGDYVSILSKELKKTYGEDFVTIFLLGCAGDVNHFDVSKASDSPDHYVKMGQKVAEETVKTASAAENLAKSGLRAELAYLDIPRIHVDEEKIRAARETVATVKEKKGVKISADNTDPEQYNRAMAKRLVDFIDSTPTVFSVPVQCIQIGEFTIYGFNSEIFTEFGRIVKRGDGTGCALVATLCNDAFGYVPTCDMFYDSIYESRPGSARLSEEAGYLMAEKLVSMKKEL